jgi:hypothetical protein
MLNDKFDVAEKEMNIDSTLENSFEISYSAVI